METLKKRMIRGEVVKILYMKLDGTLCVAVGTLPSDAVEANVIGTGVPKRDYGMSPISTLRKWLGEASKRKSLLGIIEN